MTVDPTNPGLVSGTGNANSSPWVLAIKAAGIPALDSVVNACILVSAWSAGNSYCWVRRRARAVSRPQRTRTDIPLSLALPLSFSQQ